MPDRIKKINELIKKEVSAFILSEVEFPPDTIVTIIGIETSKDLHYAKVYISVLPKENSQGIQSILNTLHLEKILFKRLSIKFFPKLQFLIDETESKALEIEELLDQIKKNG